MDTTASSREFRLVSRPQGFPTLDNFELVTVPLPAPAAGQVQVRNLFISVDPYMRGRMKDAKSYVPPFQLGQALEGGAVGEVVASHAEGFAAGDVVLSNLGWRDQFVADARQVRVVERVQPLSAYLGVLGAPGFTAWVGLDVVDTREGDRVFVSGAAGAVGTVAGQLAKLRGCRVVGSAGSAEKVRMLTEELGFDAAFDYKGGNLREKLKAAMPEGIDVYFDNVGGEQLEAAIAAMRLHGRILACGAISQYSSEEPSGPRNLSLMIGKRLTMKGFIIMDWMDRHPAFRHEVGALLAAGKLHLRETVVDGLENTAQAFLDMLRGGNTGKMVIRLT